MAMITNILSMETATDVCSVAVHQNGNLLSSFEHHVKRTHSHVLHEMVDAVLKVAQIKVCDLQAVAVGKGPGSYTGLRVGVAFAKGMCYACNIPLLPIDTLAILGASIHDFLLPESAYCYALIDAGESYAYGMVLKKQQIVRDAHLCHVVTPNIKAYIKTFSGSFCFVGNGADRYATALEGIPDTMVAKGFYPCARSMGNLAWQAFCERKIADLASFSPVYLSRHCQ